MPAIYSGNKATDLLNEIAHSLASQQIPVAKAAEPQSSYANLSSGDQWLSSMQSLKLMLDAHHGEKTPAGDPGPPSEFDYPVDNRTFTVGNHYGGGLPQNAKVYTMMVTSKKDPNVVTFYNPALPYKNPAGELNPNGPTTMPNGDVHTPIPPTNYMDAVQQAKQMGKSVLRVPTHMTAQEVNNLYKNYSSSDVPRYDFNHLDGVNYFENKVNEPSPVFSNVHPQVSSPSDVGDYFSNLAESGLNKAGATYNKQVPAPAKQKIQDTVESIITKLIRGAIRY